MIYEKFICPCCGLPNHLEFQKKEDYKTLKNISTAAQEDFKGEFSQKILNSSNVEDSGKELYKRLLQIQDISKKFERVSFEEWLNKNVVCFIDDAVFFTNKLIGVCEASNIDNYNEPIQDYYDIDEYNIEIKDTKEKDQYKYNIDFVNDPYGDLIEMCNQKGTVTQTIIQER